MIVATLVSDDLSVPIKQGVEAVSLDEFQRDASETAMLNNNNGVKCSVVYDFYII